MAGRYRANRLEALCPLSCALVFTSTGRDSRLSWARKNENFNADLWLLARRVLDAEHWAVFRFHSLMGMDWRRATFLLKMKRGRFFHCAYRAQAAVGRAAIELKPYPLFPIAQYYDDASGWR